MDIKKVNEEILAALKHVKGIVEVRRFSVEHHQQVVEIEKDAEERSLMGLGKVINTGIREVLNCELIYVALTDMDFDWGRHPSLVMKKSDQVVGEEVRDQEVLARLSGRKNVWFMHRNFVVYKDKVCFPEDIMKKVCYFEIPCIPAEWGLEKAFHCKSIFFANPATPCDIFLKKEYFEGMDKKGLGTILIGVKLQN